MQMRKCSRCCIAVMTALILLCCFLHPAFAGESPGQRVIRIGYMPGYGVITDLDETAEKGYGYEYLAEIAKYTGWTYKYVPCGWSEGLQKLKDEKIDFFGFIESTPERQNEFCFPVREIGRESVGLYIRADNEKYSFEDAESFNGMSVATEKNSAFNQLLDEYCSREGISVQLVYTDIGKFGEGLKSGKYDAVLAGSMLDLEGTIMAAKISIEPYFFAANKNQKALCDNFDAAMKQIEMKDIYFAAKLYNKYYKQNTTNVSAFTNEEKSFIERRPVIKVVCDPNWAPIEYYDYKAMRNRGISVDVLLELGQICGLNFEFLPSADYTKSKQLLRDGEASLILPHTESAEALGVEYTDSFFEVPTTLVGCSEIDVSKPLRVGVSNIQSQPAQSLMKKYPKFKMIAYDNMSELLAALRSGKEQYIYVNTYVYDEIVRGQDGSRYRSVPMDITYPLRIGVSKDTDPALLGILNKSIHRLSNGKVNSIVFTNTVNRAYKMPFSRVMRENMFTIITILTLLFVLLISLIIVISRRNQRQLERIAYVDELTGLSTLAKFQIDAVETVEEDKDLAYLLVSLDVDNFKYINDVFGYDMGNQVLRHMAQHFLKLPDAYKLVARSSADNFIFLIEAGDKEKAIERFSDMLDVSENLYDLLPPRYNLILSAGIYALSNGEESFASWCDKANIARKSAKGRHVNDFREYTPEMDAQMYWKKEVTISMEEGLQTEAFKVYLQPKVRFMDEKMVGAEALVRWQHPKEGLLQPAAFIPLFESNGFIVKLDFYMFEQVCKLLGSWIEKGLETPPISVNLSRLHLSNEHLVEDLMEITRKYHIPTNLVEIELTENIVLDDFQTLIEIMKKLKVEGFDISIDDFGSGYSSLNLLTDLPVDILKLDKGFLRKMSETGNSRLIVEQVIELAKKLHLSTVAEGVETKEQVEILQKMGCDLAQGYYFDRPMPAQQFEKKLCRTEPLSEGKEHT